MTQQAVEVILDQCVADIKAERTTLIRCLADYTDQRRELEPLLRIALAVVPPTVTPDPARKAQARYQLMAELRRTPGETPGPATHWWFLVGRLLPSQPRRFSMPVLLVIVLAFTMVTSGGAAFAAH